MSFILDALKKSEIDRQQQKSADFAGVPTSSGRAAVPRWLWGLGVLLAINLVVLLGLLFRTSTDPLQLPPAALTDNQRPDPGAFLQSTSRPDVPEPRDAMPGEASFEAQIAEAKQKNSAPSSVSSSVPASSAAAAATATSSEPAVSSAAASSAGLPTIYDVIADGTVVLPELHLDIHVYSEVPKDRFVFINMSKQRERSQLTEGPVVKEITPDGVILEYRDTSFLLPRE